MQARAFNLLNETERGRLAEDASLAHSLWAREWAAPGATPARARCLPVGASGLAVPADALSWSTGAGTLSLPDAARARRWAASAIGARAGEVSPPPGSVAAELLERALDDLARRIVAAPAERGDAPPSLAAWAPGSGAAWIGLPSPAGELDVVLDAGLVARALAGLPRPVRKGPPLADPRGCLGALPVEIRAWLGSAEIEVAVLRTLAVGDVVVLDGRLDQPLRVSVDGRPVAAQAWLGHAGARKAVRLAGTAPRQ